MLAAFAASAICAPALAQQGWTVDSPEGSDYADAAARGENENTVLFVKCTADRAGIGLTLADFWGEALGLVDGERYPVRVTFVGAGDLQAEYHLGLRYDAGEHEWNTDGYDIPLSFLDAFAKGRLMRLDRSKNIPEEIATYRLDGSAMVTRIMRKACWGRSGS